MLRSRDNNSTTSSPLRQTMILWSVNEKMCFTKKINLRHYKHFGPRPATPVDNVITTFWGSCLPIIS